MWNENNAGGELLTSGEQVEALALCSDESLFDWSRTHNYSQLSTSRDGLRTASDYKREDLKPL